MNPFEVWLLAKGISKTDFENKSVNEMAVLHNEYNESVRKELKQEIQNCATKEDVQSVSTKLNEFLENAKNVSDQTIVSLTKAVENQNDEIVKLKENGTKKEPETLKQVISKGIDSIKSLVKGTANNVVLKADTVRASVTASAQGFRLPSIGQLGIKERGIYDVFPKVSFADGDNNGKIKYIDWDEATISRSAAMVAEGTAFPESTAKFKEYSLDFKKIGDTLPVSEEFGEDQVSATAELERFLEINVNSVVDTQLAVGDGTGENLTGLNASVPSYVPVASGIQAANLKDLAIKVSNSITKDRGSKYSPDTIFLNSTSFELIQFAKDANNNYIFDDSKGTIGGLMVVIDNNLLDNTAIVGDRRFGTIYEKGGVVLSRGMQNAQFGEDMITLKARKRMLFLIRNVDKTGFSKITSISAAITTLAS